MHEITIPTLNSNDVEYVLVEWCAAPGEPVAAGQPVAVIETSKATEELASDVAGVLDHALPAGSPCRPGIVIGRVLDAGELPPASLRDPGQLPAAVSGDPAVPVLTDSARALIARHGISDERVRGLGKRVVRGADIRRLLDDVPVPQAPAAPDPVPGGADPEAETLPMSPLQRAVARTVAATLTVPAAFTVVKVYADGTDESPGLLERIIGATAAQRDRNPRFFARLADDGTLSARRGAHIGLTVDTGNGLYMPVLRDAGSLSQREISAALLRFRVKASRGRFTVAELAGSNIGITLHTESAVVVAQPVIHPENTCALAVCAMQDELQLRPDGSLRPRRYFNLGLAYDHRVVNGRDAVLFLDAIKREIERDRGDSRDRGVPSTE